MDLLKRLGYKQYSANNDTWSRSIDGKTFIDITNESEGKLDIDSVVNVSIYDVGGLSGAGETKQILHQAIPLGEVKIVTLYYGRN